MTDRKLTHKQKLFVEFFLQTSNATRAAELAGYKGKETTLAVVGSENLRKPNIAAEIESRISELIMTADECLRELSNIAEGFDLIDYLTFEKTYAIGKDGEAYFTGLTAVPDTDKMQRDGVSRLIKEVKQNSRGVTFVLHDKLRALEDMSKYWGLLIDRKDLNVNISMFPAAKIIDVINKENEKKRLGPGKEKK